MKKFMFLSLVLSTISLANYNIEANVGIGGIKTKDISVKSLSLDTSLKKTVYENDKIKIKLGTGIETGIINTKLAIDPILREMDKIGNKYGLDDKFGDDEGFFNAMKEISIKLIKGQEVDLDSDKLKAQYGETVAGNIRSLIFYIPEHAQFFEAAGFLKGNIFKIPDEVDFSKLDKNHAQGLITLNPDDLKYLFDIKNEKVAEFKEVLTKHQNTLDDARNNGSILDGKKFKRELFDDVIGVFGIYRNVTSPYVAPYINAELGYKASENIDLAIGANIGYAHYFSPKLTSMIKQYAPFKNLYAKAYTKLTYKNMFNINASFGIPSGLQIGAGISYTF